MKLGYGGTKEEMQRLLSDATKLTGVKYDIKNLNDVYSAIHAIQTNLGITGTTAKEASATIEGSFNSAKAAFENLLTGMGNKDADLDKLLLEFTDSVAVFGKNVIPVIKTAFKGATQVIAALAPELIKTGLDMLDTLLASISQNKDTLIQGFDAFMTELFNSIIEKMPEAIHGIADLFILISSAIIDNFPLILDTILKALSEAMSQIGYIISELLPKIPEFILQVVNVIVENVPLFIDAAIKLIEGLMQGISDTIPRLIEVVPQIITTITNFITEKLPELFDKGVEIQLSMIKGIVDSIPKLVEALPKVLNAITDFISENLPKILDKGTDVLFSLIDGILNAIPTLVDNLPKVINAFIDFITRNLPKILEQGIKILGKLVDGIINSLPKIVEAVIRIIVALTTSIISNLPKILAMGIKIILELGIGMIRAIPNLIATIPTIVSSIINAFASINWLDIGINIVKGIWEGMASMAGWLYQKAAGFFKGLFNSSKKDNEIQSPSKLYKRGIGKYLAQGVGVGFVDEMKNVNKMMKNSIPTTLGALDSDFSVNAKGNSLASGITQNVYITSPKALSPYEISRENENMLQRALWGL